MCNCRRLDGRRGTAETTYGILRPHQRDTCFASLACGDACAARVGGGEVEVTINPEDKGVAMSSEYWAETDIVVLAKEAGYEAY